MADYVKSPSQTVKERFSISRTGGQNEPSIPPFHLGTAPAGMEQQILPPPVSPEEIQNQFGPLIQAAELEQPPPGRDVPSPTNPWMAFAGALAANMGTSLTRNPLFAQQYAEHLQNEEKRRQAIQDENYANELLFSKEKRTKLFVLRGQILEKQIDEAIKANDFDRAQIAAANLQKLQESMKRSMLPEETAAREHEIRVSGEEQRKLERLRLTAEKEKETKAAAGKPLTMDQYQDNIRDAMRLKPENLPTTKEGFSIFGFHTPFGEEKMTKADVLEVRHAEAALSTDQAVSIAGKRNLILSISKRLGVDPMKTIQFASGDKKALTKEETQKFDAELAKYGL